jgi:hypothetical protein
MENYYEAHMNSIATQLYEMLEVDGVIKFFKSIYYGNNEKQREIFDSMMFLAYPKFDNPTEWVKKAIFEFDTKDVFNPIRTETSYPAWMKCFFVKTYRVMVKDKRKMKLDPTVTAEELANKVLEILNT